MDSNKQSNQFPIPGIALIFLAIGVFVFSDNPFKPTRPDAPSELTVSAEDVRARLWQDPFVAVERHRVSKHANSANSELKNLEEFIISITGNDVRKNKPSALKSKLTKNSKYQNQQHRVCIYKKDSSLSAHTINELRCQIQRDVPNSNKEVDLHIMAVMVPGGPYAEDAETRIRNRYAVISGLSNAGYIPSDAEHISYMDFTDLCKEALNGEKNKSRFCDWPATIPYEWFQPNNIRSDDKEIDGANRILVLWLDDEAISRVSPLQMLIRLRNGLTPKKGDYKRFSYIANENQRRDVSVKLDVLGPDSSTTLLKMYEDTAVTYKETRGEKRIFDDEKKSIRIFSFKATIDTSVIDGSFDGERTDKAKLDNHLQASRLLKEYKVVRVEKVAGEEDGKTKSYNDTHVASFELIRTLPTDKLLVKKLLCELVLRGVNPYKYDKGHYFSSECKGEPEKKIRYNKNNSQDHIVLIGEWDTVYSRSFNYLFKSLITKGDSEEILPLEAKARPPTWLHSYNYYRGIDGSTGTGQDEKESSDKNNDKSILRRPVGENQFDYLRRLGEQIMHLSESLKADRKGNVRAIGIVGSDTYDKLLVLQALRNKFPQVLFFTTDLDARMLHAEENDWTRNLIVASAFGLTLDSDGENKLDARLPAIPFRDTYQTSLYHSTLMAVHKNADYHINDEVKIFEIGFDQAIDYSYMHKVEHYKKGYGLQLIASIFLLAVLIYRKLSKSFLYRAVLLMTMVFVVVCFLGLGIYYRLALLMMLLLIYQANNTSRKYLIMFSATMLSVAIWVSMFDTGNSIEFNNMFSGTSIWPSVIIKMIASVLAVVFIFYVLSGLRSNNNKIIESFVFDIAYDKGFYERLCLYVKDHSFTHGDNQALIIYVIDEILFSLAKLKKAICKVIITLTLIPWRTLMLFKWFILGGNQSLEKAEPIKKGLSKWSRYFITLWCWCPRNKEKINIHEFFVQYLELGRGRYWSRRVFSMFFLYLIVTTTFLFSFASLPVSPFHGDVSFKANQAAMFSLVFFYPFLIFLVVDVTRLNARFVKLLFQERCDFAWTEKYIHGYAAKYGVSDSVAGEKFKFDLIVIRSKAVDILIFLPFIILTLMILSRSSYFDNWHMPAQLAAVILLGACIALSSAIRLRRTAKKSRKCAIDNLEEIYKMHVYEEAKRDKAESIMDATRTDWKNEDGVCEYKMSERIRQIINEIELVKEGPYAPIAQHPIVSAIAMPFGGVGGLYLIDYFANIGV